MCRENALLKFGLSTDFFSPWTPAQSIREKNIFQLTPVKSLVWYNNLQINCSVSLPHGASRWVYVTAGQGGRQELGFTRQPARLGHSSNCSHPAVRILLAFMGTALEGAAYGAVMLLVTLLVRLWGHPAYWLSPSWVWVASGLCSLAPHLGQAQAGGPDLVNKIQGIYLNWNFR